MTRGLVPAYRARDSPLHAARAGATTALCAALALICAVYSHPIVLLGVIVGAVVSGIAAKVSQEVARAARLAVPLALLVTLINPLLYAQGNTILVRGGSFLGRRFDITLEALAAGGLAGLRVGAFLMVFGLFSACVDPDELLRLFRRFSYRSALTASLATRLVPVLGRDALRMGDAARCRPEAPGRLAVARATLSGALDRAVDVAAALEVRGYSTAGRPRAAHAPWSRHDLSVVSAAGMIAAGAVAARIAGAGEVVEYPTFEVAVGPAEVALAVLIALAAGLPFAGRTARLGVARA